MDILTLLLKFINPLEWIKECYKMPIGVKFIAILVCFCIFLLPDNLKSINIHYMRVICTYLLPLIFVCFSGELLQNPINRNKEEIKQNEIKKKAQEVIQDYFRRFNNLHPNQIKLLERIANENTTTIYADYDTANIAQELYYNGFDFIKGCGENVYISQFGLDLIKKYFNK